MLDDEALAQRSALFDVAAKLLGSVKRHGAQEADIMATRSTEFEVKVADGAIVTLTQATSKGLGIRVFVDGRLGFCTTSDFASDSLEQAGARAVAMAKEAAADPHNGIMPLPQGELNADASLELFDPRVVDLSTEEKIRWAHGLEEAARAADPRVRKFRDSGVSTGVTDIVLMTSGGAMRSLRQTSISLWCTPVAEADGQLQTEIWYDSQSHVSDLEPVEQIGRIAGMRAARMLGARPVKTQEAAIIFEPGTAAALLNGILQGIDGDMVHKKASFLADKLGQQIAARSLTLVDDPLLPRGIGTSPFDGEGLPTQRKNIVDKGILTTFLYDGHTARKAKVQPTGNAQRSFRGLPHAGAFNFYAEAGTDDVAEIYRSVPRALLVTRGLGQGLNAVSGEYSRGANGLWLEHGEVIHPVQEVTIAGDYLSMLQGIDRVGSDLRLRGGSGAPTLRLAKMTISGS